ncbi:gas vesicle protein GvpG [Streptomyces sp. NPDC047002]|uniref:gas vesicle protein GvpG n=1 Tax=Streptomyces sp. NPDC047002 TaxID=3155475 RepID=UPI003451FC84
MGLISGLLTLPVAPVRGFTWVLGQVMTAAEQEYYDPAPVRAELAELERQLLAGRISEEEFDRREDDLLDRLELIQYERRRLGLDA